MISIQRKEFSALPIAGDHSGFLKKWSKCVAFFLEAHQVQQVTAVGFEPTPLRTGA